MKAPEEELPAGVTPLWVPVVGLVSIPFASAGLIALQEWSRGPRVQIARIGDSAPTGTSAPWIVLGIIVVAIVVHIALRISVWLFRDDTK